MAQLLAPIAVRRGDAPALIDESGETSWRDFDLRVNRLIHALRARGLPVGSRIAVVSGNRREYFEVLCAAAHAGWIVVPVNWHFAAEEVSYVLENSDARVLVADVRFQELAETAVCGNDAVETRLLVGGPPGGGFEAYEDFLASGSPDEPADQGLGGVMFYTSGTTGRPKGVISSTYAQAGGPLTVMEMMFKGFAGMLGIPEDGVTLLAGPLYHSAQWAFSMFPLGSGSTIVMRHKFDAAETLELIDRHGVTNVHLVPTQFIRMLRLAPEVREAFSGASLKAVWHGGAPCPEGVKREMIGWWGPVVTEYYGGTEGAIVSLISAEEWLERPHSVGRPVGTVEVRVVDEEGRRCPAGQPGQIYLKSRIGMDFEYHKEPEKTAGAHLGPGVFTLGDVGYLDDEGYLHLSDRKIDMIISGGVNIYPAEIESVLSDHPKVRDVAVFGIPHEEFGEQVKAAVELVDDCQPSDELADELIATCRERLAGYKAPRSVDFLDALPRHPTGKLYKRLLRDPYWEGHTRKI
jgi:long-chain acyl-CoA synthetase